MCVFVTCPNLHMIVLYYRLLTMAGGELITPLSITCTIHSSKADPAPVRWACGPCLNILENLYCITHINLILINIHCVQCVFFILFSHYKSIIFVYV